MLKKTINYTDFDGNPVSEVFCFNLTKAECIDLDFMYEEHGGLKEYLSNLVKKIQADPDHAPKRPMYEFLKLMIRMSVGKRVGNKFVKNDEIANEFLQTEAYSEFLMDLLNTEKNPNGVEEFMSGILPEISEEQKQAAISQMENEGIHIVK